MSDSLLTISGLNVHYGLSHVLHELSLDIKCGETVALMGRNGMGKTTLLKTLVGLLPSTSG